MSKYYKTFIFIFYAKDILLFLVQYSYKYKATYFTVYLTGASILWLFFRLKI